MLDYQTLLLIALLNIYLQLASNYIQFSIISLKILYFMFYWYRF